MPVLGVGMEELVEFATYIRGRVSAGEKNSS
jgi:hypothetical protein